jgi:hypothetical protein
MLSNSSGRAKRRGSISGGGTGCLGSKELGGLPRVKETRRELMMKEYPHEQTPTIRWRSRRRIGRNRSQAADPNLMPRSSCLSARRTTGNIGTAIEPNNGWPQNPTKPLGTLPARFAREVTVRRRTQQTDRSNKRTQFRPICKKRWLQASGAYGRLKYCNHQTGVAFARE